MKASWRGQNASRALRGSGLDWRRAEGREHPWWDKQSEQRCSHWMPQGTNTQPQMQPDIHVSNAHCMLNSDSPKMDRAVPPENRLGSRGHLDREGNQEEKAGRRPGRRIDRERAAIFAAYHECAVLGRKVK